MSASFNILKQERRSGEIETSKLSIFEMLSAQKWSAERTLVKVDAYCKVTPTPILRTPCRPSPKRTTLPPLDLRNGQRGLVSSQTSVLRRAARCTPRPPATSGRGKARWCLGSAPSRGAGGFASGCAGRIRALSLHLPSCDGWQLGCTKT